MDTVHFDQEIAICLVELEGICDGIALFQDRNIAEHCMSFADQGRLDQLHEHYKDVIDVMNILSELKTFFDTFNKVEAAPVPEALAA